MSIRIAPLLLLSALLSSLATGRDMPVRAETPGRTIAAADAEPPQGAPARGALPDVRMISIRGAILAVQVAGEGRPIVFLHGGMASFDINFRAQREDFAVDHRVVGIDQRGHGRSPDTPAPFTYRDMAEDTAAVMRQMSLAPADVVGFSDGADVALLLAAHHPELVRRVVAVGANLRGDAYGAAAVERLKRASAAGLAASAPPPLRANYARLSPDGAGHWEAFVEKTRQLWLTPEVISPLELNAIRAPVLVVAGDDDEAPIERTLEIWHGIEHAQLYIVPGADHLLLMKRTQEADATIRRFLDEDSAH